MIVKVEVWQGSHIGGSKNFFREGEDIKVGGGGISVHDIQSYCTLIMVIIKPVVLLKY